MVGVMLRETKDTTNSSDYKETLPSIVDECEKLCKSPKPKSRIASQVDYVVVAKGGGGYCCQYANIVNNGVLFCQSNDSTIDFARAEVESQSI